MFVRSKKSTHVQVYWYEQSSQSEHTILQLLTAHRLLTLLTSYNFTSSSDLTLKLFSFITSTLLNDIRLLASWLSLMKRILELYFSFVSSESRSKILSLMNFRYQENSHPENSHPANSPLENSQPENFHPENSDLEYSHPCF